VAFFALATPVSAIFVMQDYVLTGAGRATTVPTENLVFSLLKLGLLAVAAVLVVPGGIAVSWVVATGVVVVVLNLWLLVRELPRFGRRTHARRARSRRPRRHGLPRPVECGGRRRDAG
jgi:hypothetical protein